MKEIKKLFKEEQNYIDKQEEGKKIKRQRIRVGINEGIIIERKKIVQEDFEPQSEQAIHFATDGLSTCAALVVANNKYVFMAHVRGLDTDFNTQKTIDKRAEEYLKNIILWMKDNSDNKNTEIQVGLVCGTGEETSATCFAFKKVCSKLTNDDYILRNSSPYCAVIIYGSEIQINPEKLAKFHITYNEVNKKERAQFVKNNINASCYDFGIAASGNSDTEKDLEYIKEDIAYIFNTLNTRELSKEENKLLEKTPSEWKKSADLRKAVIVMCEYLNKNSEKGTIGFVNDILSRITSYLKEKSRSQNKLNNAGYCRICKELIIAYHEGSQQTFNPDEIIKSAVQKAIASAEKNVAKNIGNKKEEKKIIHRKFFIMEKNYIENKKNQENTNKMFSFEHYSNKKHKRKILSKIPKIKVVKKKRRIDKKFPTT